MTLELGLRWFSVPKIRRRLSYCSRSRTAAAYSEVTVGVAMRSGL